MKYLAEQWPPQGLSGVAPQESSKGEFNHPRSRARDPEDTEVRGEEVLGLCRELDEFGGMLPLSPAFLNPNSSNVCHGRIRREDSNSL